MSAVKRTRRKSGKPTEEPAPASPVAAAARLDSPQGTSPQTTPEASAGKMKLRSSGKHLSSGKKAQKPALEPTNDPEDAGDSCVLYVGHIPHGFYEKEMGLYFAQFGDIKNLRICRAWKTGASRGYGFIEFATPVAASAAAEAMSGYLMHGRSLRTEVVPKSKVHPETFKGANRAFGKQDWVGKRRQETARNSQDGKKLKKRMKRIEKKHAEKKVVLKKMGVAFEAPDIVGQAVAQKE